MGGAASSSEMAPAALATTTFKMSAVIDQSDDSEFMPEGLATADRWYQMCMMVMGPSENEGCTGRSRP